MNEIKIFLKASGSIAELYKDFNLYKGAYRNAQISVYVPKSLLYTIPAANIAPAVKTGAILTAPNGSKVTTDSHGADYVKDETVGNVAYSVFTQILPKEYCMYAGTQTIVVNVVNVDGTNASSPAAVSVITSQTAQIAVQESAYVADEQILDPTQAEAIQAQQTAQDVRITKNETDIAALQEEVQQNTSNISKNAGDIADLQAQMTTGENYIGQMKGFSLPTSEQLGTFVSENTEPSRQPQGGDSVIFLLQSFEEDGTISEKPYKYIYGASGWNGYEISPIQTAENGTAGLVSGTYGVDSENNLLADITGGKIVELYFKGADGEYKPVSSSLSSLISTLDGIIGGTVGVGLAGMAIRDRNGNIIDITYQTKEEGATKEFVENYALPKTFSDVKYIAADGYSDTVPTTPSNGIQFSVGTSGTSTFEVFELDRTLADGYELTKNNSTTNVLWIMSGVSDTPSFRLVTQAKKASESAWTTLSSQESGPVAMEGGTPVKVTFYSNFSALDSATVSLADGDEIRQMLYVTPGTSATNAYAVYSSATYPSTFAFNTNTLAVGELSGDFVTTNTAQTISGAKTFTNGATAVQPNNTTPAFSVTYSGGILSFYADKITYLPASGGNTYTFTFPSENGVVALVSDINALDSTLRAYITQQLALKFDKTGGTISGNVNVTQNVTAGGNVSASGDVTAGGDVTAQSGNFSKEITVDKQITMRGNPETDTSESVLQHKEYGFNFYEVEEGTDLSGKSLFIDTGISPLEDSNFNGTSLETLISFQNGYTLYVNPNVSPSNYSVYMATPSGGISYFYLNGQWMTDVYTFTGSGWVVSSVKKENFESDAAQILADMLVVGTFFVPSRTRFDDGAQIPLTPSGAFDVANKQYVDVTVKTEAGDLQQAIDNEASARAAADTALRNSKYDKTGGTISGNVQITGDLTVQGTTTTNDTETLAVKDNLIVTNSDGATLSGLSGLIIRTSPTQSYGIVYDPANEGTVKLGLGSYNSDTGVFTFATGEGLPVAIRALSTAWNNLHLAAWDAASNQFIDAGKAVADFQEKLTFDTTPTQNSTNPVTSGGVFAALQDKQNELTAGEGILISDTDVISFDTTVLDGYVTETGLTDTLAGYVTLDTAQTITGHKTFQGGTNPGAVNKFTGWTDFTQSTTLIQTLYTNTGISWLSWNSFRVDFGSKSPLSSFSIVITNRPQVRLISSGDTTHDVAFLDDVEPVSEQVSDLSQSVDDIYTILQQEVYNAQDIEQEYSSRETADGADIIDGALETVKKIQGSTVKTTNLLPFPYLDGASYTSNGVTFTANSDGSVIVNGTPTDYIYYRFISDFRGVGEFILSGIPSSANLSFTFTAYNSAGDSIGSVEGLRGQTIQFNTADYEGYDHALLQIRRVRNNIAINNVTVYPMLNRGDSALPYSPYFPGLKNAYFQGLQSTGRNLIPFPYYDDTKTINGVTFTVNDDGSVTANGTATASASFALVLNTAGKCLVLQQNTAYFLSGCPSGGSFSTFSLTIQEISFSQTVADYGNGVSFTTQFTNYYLFITIFPGYTANNLRFYPMFNYGSSALPYEPYISHEVSLPEPVELPKWDSIDMVRGKRIVQSNTLTFDRTETWRDYSNENYFSYVSPSFLTLTAKTTSDIICNKLNTGYPMTGAAGCSATGVQPNGYSSFQVSFSKTAYPDMTLDAWKAQLAAWAAAGDPLTVCYQTATATESDISMEDRLPAYKNGSETVIQGATDNSEYGAENTLTQNYAEVRGTTETTEGGMNS